jgi:hypothetical protein
MAPHRERRLKKEYLHLLEDAMVQWRLMQSRKEDRDFEDADGTIIYAIDADIFKMYGDPKSVAKNEGHRLGYGQVFRSDTEEQNTAIASRLADYIFFYLDLSLPLLIIPPIEIETASILNALIGKLGSEPPTEWLDKELLKTLQDNLPALRDVPSDIYEKFLQFVYLKTSSPEEEYRRLCRLLESNRIASPEVFSTNETVPESVRQVLRPFSKVTELIQHSTFKNGWYDALTDGEEKHFDWRKRVKFERDADALARLELWNKMLVPLNYRIVYITGARHILNCAYSNSVSIQSFTKRCIRHPRYFLAHEGSMQKKQNEESAGEDRLYASSFEKMIQVFLANSQILEAEDFPSEVSTKLNLEQGRAALSVLSSKPGLATEFSREWAGYLDWVLDSYQSPKQIQRKITEELGSILGAASLLSSWQKVRDGLDVKIESEVESAWDACFRQAASSGYVFGANRRRKGQAFPARILAPLRLDHGQKTQAFLYEMSHVSTDSGFNHAAYQDGVEAIHSEWETENDRKYIYYLVHAALFAALAEWEVAERLAIRAVRFSECPTKERRHNAHGREAYFLAAVCRRYAFENASDLIKAKGHLNKAKNILIDETSLDPTLDVLPERFEAEELAIEVTELMLSRLPDRGGSASHTRLIAPNDEWESDARLLNTKQMELIKRLAEIESKLASSSEQNKESVFDDLLRLTSRLKMNTCSLQICMRTPNIASILKIATEIEKTQAGAAKRDKNYFRDCVLLLSKALQIPAAATREAILSQFSDENIKLNKLMPYDTGRFLLMKDLALRSLVKYD